MDRLATEVDRDATEPLYRQIANSLRTRLDAGEFAVGDTLPAEKTLAARLGLAHETVRGAYKLLVNEGYLFRGRGQPTTVRVVPKPQEISGESVSADMLTIEQRRRVEALRLAGEIIGNLVPHSTMLTELADYILRGEIAEVVDDEEEPA